MTKNLKEGGRMTNKQFDTMRNDLIDLMIAMAKLILKDEKELAKLVEEFSKLKH